MLRAVHLSLPNNQFFFTEQNETLCSQMVAEIQTASIAWRPLFFSKGFSEFPVSVP